MVFKLQDKTLDKYQSKAVYCNKKSYLVVAGAGSGKTLTIVAKIKYLVDSNIKEGKILCISFTNETVNSLKDSLKKYNLNVDVKTFHKLALDILGNVYQVSSNNLLEYIASEYFASIVYQENTQILLEYVKNVEYLQKLIVNFIHQFKTMNYDYQYLINLLKDKNIDIDDRISLAFISRVFLLYQEELESTLKIDFDDIINLAIKRIDTLKYFKYSHIIIDEYQDTSLSKYILIKKLVTKFSLNFMAVGDDYQSIYSFSGCNLKLFTNFKKYFPKSKIIKLKNTYRNPSDIVEISKRFVMKNRNQLNKRLKSDKYVKDSIEVVYYNNLEKAFNKVIKNIDNIMLLGRNNKDLNPLLDENILKEDNDRLIYLKDDTKNIRFLTVHSSKGLEEENVIILNVIDDTLGFPNQIRENNILSYITTYNEQEEERRLFYVALTRAKNRVYLFTIKNKESIFIKELIKEFKYKIKIIDLQEKNF